MDFNPVQRYYYPAGTTSCEFATFTYRLRTIPKRNTHVVPRPVTLSQENRYRNGTKWDQSHDEAMKNGNIGSHLLVPAGPRKRQAPPDDYVVLL